jgi:O-antigen ligase
VIPARYEARLHRLALWLLLLLPAALFYARAVAEAMMVAVGLLFLASAAGRDGGWLRQTWVRVTAAWFLWFVACSAVGAAGLAGFGQAVAAVRFPLFAIAVATWVLAEPRWRRAMLLSLSLAAVWLVAQAWQQQLTGTNLFGTPRYADGALTGPFSQPRAGAAYALIFFPAVLPWVIRLGERPQIWGRAAGLALLAFAVATMVLIGQRMPTLLMVLGLVLTALLLPRLRMVALVALGLGALLLAASPILSPPTFNKLVLRFWEQLSNFPASPYGQLYIRAVNITQLHPWMGGGHDAFRTLCVDPATALGLPWLGIPAAAAASADACNIHPHNFYLEAATAGGLPGLALFAAMVLSWLLTLARRLRGGDVLATALFVQVFVAMWPLASTNAFLSVPNVGWIFLMLGFAMAAAQPNAALPRRT